MLEYHEPLMEVSEKYGIQGYLLHRGNTHNGIRQGKMARWGFTE